MKAILMMAVMLLASCGDKRDETEVNKALLEVRMAAWDVMSKRAEADRRDATAADGVDYRTAIDRLSAAERMAAEKLGTPEEIRIQRQLGETEGRKSAREISEHLRKLQ